MSFVVTYQGNIGAQWINSEGKQIAAYNGKPLIALQQSGNLNPVYYPICMSEAQFNAIELSSRVFAILSSTSVSPAKSAGFDRKKLCPIADRIEDLYNNSMKSYLRRLDDCVKVDTTVWRKYENLYLIQRFWPKITGQIWTDGSASRLAWCSEVSALEKIRLEETKFMIEQTCIASLADAEEDARHNEMGEPVRVLRQLNKIYTSVFPECGPLIINDVNIQEYVDALPPGAEAMPVSFV